MDLTLRPGRPEDAAALGRICFDAFTAISGQHNFPGDFPSPDVAVGLCAWMLGRADGFSVVAERDGQIVGSNFLWEDAVIAGVGPITVDPRQQNASVGRRLMEGVLARARERRFVGVRLVQAAFHGRSMALYTKLGFDVREPLSCMNGPSVTARIPGFQARAMRTADIDACNALCRRVHGFARGVELAGAVQQATAHVVEHDGRIAAYTSNLGFFGHSVADSNHALMALIGAGLPISGPGFLLPSRNGELLRWCLDRSLRIVQPLTLMSQGLYTEPAGVFLPSILY